jgi:hypothetical protein
VSMAERTGERTAWVERARDALRYIEQAEAAERASLARLPYTREELEQAFAEIRKAAKDRPKARAAP